LHPFQALNPKDSAQMSINPKNSITKTQHR